MVQLFSTLPQRINHQGRKFSEDEIKRFTRLNEELDFDGIYLHNRYKKIDNWRAAEIILKESEKLLPIVSLHSKQLDAKKVARKISEYACGYKRKVGINLTVKKPELNMEREQKRHLQRITNFIKDLRRILIAGASKKLNGELNERDSYDLIHPLPQYLMPELFITGLTEHAAELAEVFNATFLEYPNASFSSASAVNNHKIKKGLKFGMICRNTYTESWAVARVRFPESSCKEHQNGLRASMNGDLWKQKRLRVCWMEFNHNSNMEFPYLVGCGEKAAEEIGNFTDAGYETCILELPVSREELCRANFIFKRATSEMQML